MGKGAFDRSILKKKMSIKQNDSQTKPGQVDDNALDRAKKANKKKKAMLDQLDQLDD